MHISFVEILNFRKLQAVRVDFAEKQTILVGPNNSGKTSAMVALKHFLVKSRFTTNDLTLSNRPKILAIGAAWESQKEADETKTLSIRQWAEVLPSLDLWIKVRPNELQYISHVIPTLDWEGGLLGIRLRFQPKNINELFRAFISARNSAKETIAAAIGANAEAVYKVPLWPSDIAEFLERSISTYFTIRAYPLDATKLVNPENGIAKPQQVPDEIEPIEGNPLEGLIKVNEITAQRGLSDDRGSDDNDEELTDDGERILSEQLRTYYARHLDPAESPEPKDIAALEAIFNAQQQFNERLKDGFTLAINEVQSIGYPGMTDPRLVITSHVKPIHGLNHPTALQYEVMAFEGGDMPPRLPERYCGLGYQNLISMVFRLMAFRDAWMRVGKAGKKAPPTGRSGTAPLHLVLIEEPEAHLHAQVQQVFIRKAYDILRNHSDLGDKPNLTTQMVVSTHSSHIAHECQFRCLRYFRRRPAAANGEVPTATVINLSEVFGPDDETSKFVRRYLRSTHCDLFFADGAILVEGPAERLLVPHFIQSSFADLHQSYITILEVNGSHAHRFRPLIEHLGLNTLIIGDIDAMKATEHNPGDQPKRGANQLTRNETLKRWVPAKSTIDELLDCPAVEKEKREDVIFAVRAAYQNPIMTRLRDGDPETEALANTFEDALVFTNLSLFRGLSGNGLIANFRSAIDEASNLGDLGEKMFEILKGGGKAEFALNLLYIEDLNKLQTPKYITEGLMWLQEQIKRRQLEVLKEAVAPTATNSA